MSTGKNIICIFIFMEILLWLSCTTQQVESDALSNGIQADVVQEGWALEPSADAHEEIAALWNCPKERVHQLQVSGSINNPFKDKPLMPDYLGYKDGVLYVYDENSNNVLMFDSKLKYLGNVFENGYIDPEENVACLRIDDEGSVVLTGQRYIYFSGESPRKRRNLYGLQRLIPFDDRLLSPNWGWVFSSEEFMFDIFDHDLKYIKSVGKQMYLISDDDRTTNIYLNVLGDNIYIIPSDYLKLGMMNVTNYDIEEMRLNAGDGILGMEENNYEYLEDALNYKRKVIFSDAVVLGDKVYAMSAFNISYRKNYITVIEFDDKLKMNNLFYYSYTDSKDYKIYVHHMAAFTREENVYLAIAIRATVEIEDSSKVYIFITQGR